MIQQKMVFSKSWHFLSIMLVKFIVLGNARGHEDKQTNSSQLLQPSNLLINDSPCIGMSSCSNPSQSVMPRCYCDESCYLFGDCCHDVPKNDSKKSGYDDDKTLLMKSMTCSPGLMERLETGFRQVSTCLGNAKDLGYSERVFSLFKAMCTEDESVLYGTFYLVTHTILVTDKRGLIFKNMYCGLCNGRSMEDMEFWSLYFVTEWCTDIRELPQKSTLTRKIASLLYEKKCPFYMIAPVKTTARLCQFEMLQNSPTTYCNEVSQTACLNHSNPVEVSLITKTAADYRLWKNVYCASCNFLLPNISINQVVCPKTLASTSLHQSFSGEYLKDGGTALLMEFNAEIPLNIPDTPKEEVIDCPRGKISHSNRCVAMEKTRNALIHVPIRLMSYNRHQDDVIRSVASAMKQVFKLKNLFAEIVGLLELTDGTWKAYGSFNSSLEHCSTIEFNVSIRTFGWMSSLELSALKEWCTNVNFRYDEENYFERNYYIMVRDTPTAKDILPHCTLVIKSKRNVDSQLVSSNIFNDTQFKNLKKGLESNCDAYKMKVATDLNSDGSFYKSPVALECLADILPERKISPHVMDLTSLLFQYISGGLGLTLMMFSIFTNVPKVTFQSTSGYNVIHVLSTCSLALGGIAVCPISEEFDISRYAVQFTVLYLWYCAFTWMCISSFHLWFLFRQRVHDAKTEVAENPFMSKIYPVIGYGIPFVYVIIVVSLSVSHCCDLEIRYKGFGCHPSGFSTLLVAYIVPMSLSVMFSFLFLVLTKLLMTALALEQPWLTYRLFHGVTTTVAVCILILFCVNISAHIFSNEVIWETFLVLSPLFGVTINVCFLWEVQIIDKYNNE